MVNQQHNKKLIHQRITGAAPETCPKIESLLRKRKICVGFPIICVKEPVIRFKKSKNSSQNHFPFPLFLFSDKLLSLKDISLPILICILCIYYATGCSTTKNYAPVRNYHQNSLNNEKYYVVKQGDTLYSIGFRSGSDYKQLASWNKIPAPYLLKIGQKIQLFQSKQRPRKSTKFYNKNIKLKIKNKFTKKTLTISNDNKKVLKFHWQWPLKGQILKTFSKTANKGIDIAGKIGQKVKSAATGKVVYSGAGLAGYGNLLIIKHNNSYLSAYANNSRLLVKEGNVVKKGQVIAEVGRIGVKQASLHFEIRKNGKPVNPLVYLPKK